MIIEPKRLSQLIREKKKKVLQAEPEMVDVDYKPDLNPMDMDNIKQQGRIEETLDTPHKINAQETSMHESGGNDIGVTPEQKTRMGRLRAYFASLHLSA